LFRPELCGCYRLEALGCRRRSLARLSAYLPLVLSAPWSALARRSRPLHRAQVRERLLDPLPRFTDAAALPHLHGLPSVRAVVLGHDFLASNRTVEELIFVKPEPKAKVFKAIAAQIWRRWAVVSIVFRGIPLTPVVIQGLFGEVIRAIEKSDF
jgi:hypothetical protein